MKVPPATPALAAMPESDVNFGFLINDVARLLRQRFDQRAQGLGLTRTQWRAIAHISRQEGIHQAALAEALEVEPISLARLVDRLEAGGFVERRHDPSDRRTWRLYLTAKVDPIAERMRALGTETVTEAFAGLDQGEIQHLRKALSRMKTNLSSSLLERERFGLRRAGGRHG